MSAGPTPFGMIVVGDETVTNELVKKKVDEAAATGRGSVAEPIESRGLRNISGVTDGAAVTTFPDVPGYGDLRPVYSIVRFSGFFAVETSLCPSVFLHLCFRFIEGGEGVGFLVADTGQHVV